MKVNSFIKLIIPMIMCYSGAFAQGLPNPQQVKDKELKVLTGNPDLLNDAMSKYLFTLKDTGVNAIYFLNAINLSLKTFQADGQPPGLGFSYKYENSWVKNNKDTSRSRSISLNLNGNVAFRKIYNPNNFLESKLTYNQSFFRGGFAKKNTREEADALFAAVAAYAKAIEDGDTAKQAAMKKEMDRLAKLTDQFYFGLNGTMSFESNQDFSKKQYVPGLLINVGAKAWNKDGALRWFNIPDYPFALLRMLTTDNHQFNVSGASIPSVLFGLDYVLPGEDSLRKAVTGKLDPYKRIRFEAAFKTQAASVGNQVIWFSADYRWYHELGASDAIVKANIENFHYFTCNLSSSNGFFVSYAHGRLPFDKKSENVYGIGFHYDLGKWK